MKSTRESFPLKPERLEIGTLAEYRANEYSFVVLLSKSQDERNFAGVVVWSNHPSYKAGHFDTGWCPDQFTKFAGKVTLEQ